MYNNNNNKTSLFSHGGDNLVLLGGVPVVKHSEQIFPGAVDGLAQQEVGEEKLVALVVKLVISIGSSSLESLFSCLLQLLSLETGKLLIELLEGLLADGVPALPGHDHVEQHLGQQLHPDGEVIHASSPAEEPGPHVEPVLEADAGDRHLVGPERLPKV